MRAELVSAISTEPGLTRRAANSQASRIRSAQTPKKRAMSAVTRAGRRTASIAVATKISGNSPWSRYWRN